MFLTSACAWSKISGEDKVKNRILREWILPFFAALATVAILGMLLSVITDERVQAQEPSTGQMATAVVNVSVIVSYDEARQKFDVEKVNDGFIGKAISESKKVSESLAVVMVSRARDSSGKFRCVILGVGEKLHRGALGNTFLLRFVNADEDICIFQPTG